MNVFATICIGFAVIVLTGVLLRRMRGRREDTGLETLTSNQGFAVVSAEESKAVPYPYVYVEDDGGVRELYVDERKYLETKFLGADGARPYTKNSYLKKNGWGKLRGFLKRSEVPVGVRVEPVAVDGENVAL
jgi:hypothetical protein